MLCLQREASTVIRGGVPVVQKLFKNKTDLLTQVFCDWMVLSKTVKDLRQARTRSWSSITEVLPISPWRCRIRVSARDSFTLRSKTFTISSYTVLCIYKKTGHFLSHGCLEQFDRSNAQCFRVGGSRPLRQLLGPLSLGMPLLWR